MFCAIVKENASVSLDHENTEYEWMPLDSTRSQLMWPSDRTALDEVCEVILNNGQSKVYQRIDLPG